MIYIFLFILGSAIGSFLNVLIDRLPNEESITGRSHCDYCKKKLQWIDLFPVVSFLMLGGKCRYCKKKLSLFYPFVEVLTGIMFVLTWMFFISMYPDIVSGQIIPSLLLLFYIISLFGIISTLIVIFFADAKYRIIPDSMQIALFIFSFISVETGHAPSLQLTTERIIAAIVITAPILFLYLITKGKGMGFGDVKLAISIGLLLGIKAGLIALYIGFILGAIVGIILIFRKKKKLKSKIAFGPFLVLGITTMLFFEKEIFELIRRLYGI